MRPELDNQLRLRHRKIFLDPDPADRLAALDFELQVDDGWYSLLDVLCTDLQLETDSEGAPQVKAIQVKEKFGRLRFRTRGASDRQRAMIFLAESLSERTCEVCGAPADELLVLERSPRCQDHGTCEATTDEDESVGSRWLRLLQERWREFRGRGKDSEKLALSAKLNQAIRDGDLAGVEAAVHDGVNLCSCTFDTDGFHTPVELAVQYGNEEIAQLIAQSIDH